MKLLVAGGAGFIGSVTTAMLVDAGHQVVVLDDLSTGHRDAVPDGATLVEASIHDAAGIITAQAGFDGLINFAAHIAAGESVERPDKYWRNNTIGAIALLDAAVAAGVPRVVVSSTALAYGDPDPADLPIPETAPEAPPNPYAASKLAVDHALAGYATAYGMSGTSLRYYNAAGAWRTWGERHDPETHLIPMALQVAAGQRDHLTLYGTDYPTPDGTCIRDYVHVADLARAHLAALEAMQPGQPGQYRVYNLGTGTGHSNRQVIDAVRHVTGHPIPVIDADRRPGDTTAMYAASNRAADELGWKPDTPAITDIVADAWRHHQTGTAEPAQP